VFLSQSSSNRRIPRNKKKFVGKNINTHKSTALSIKRMTTGETMVVFVKISKNGKLRRIKEVPDKFRDQAYIWDEDE